MSAAGDPAETRGDRVAAVVARQLGLALEAFHPERVARLLRSLPDELGPADHAVLARLVESLSVGETWFHRDASQLGRLRGLAARVELPPSRRKLRVWSAGCATGEEAYSLAALLGDAAPGGVEVLGTDLNPSFVDRAREGRYSAWSMREAGPAVLPWLEFRGLEVRVRDALRARVRFEHGNLVGRPFPEDLDVVVCRNVLIYFTPVAAREFLARLSDHLRVGALLALAAVDPAPPRERWEPVGEPGDALYRRVPARAAPEPPPAPSPPRREPSRDPVAILGLARDLANQGEGLRALDLLDTLGAETGIEVEGNVLACLVGLELGDLPRALRHARRACFLAPGDVVPLYLLADLQGRTGHPREAARTMRRARRALAEIADLEAPLPHGLGLSGAQLDRLLARGVEP